MVYQDKMKYFNYKQLEFVLAKSNPTKYANQTKASGEVNANKVGVFEFGKELTNKSELKLLEKVNH